jgi:Arc/MetJ family transcription regulator
MLKCVLKELAMRTNIVIDEALVRKARKYTGIKTKRKLVDFALRELVRRKERMSILDLKGKLRWEGNLDESRKARFNDTD